MGAWFSADRNVALTVEWRPDRQKECPPAILHDLAAGTVRELTDLAECGRWEAFALDPSGTVATSGAFDGVVRVGRSAGRGVQLLLGHRGTIDRTAISPDLRWLATTGEDNTLRLWPLPDLSKPPLHTLPRDALLAKLRSLTNLRATRDASAPNGWTVELGPFPGWKTAPTW
jgi:WD40 repeat protein